MLLPCQAQIDFTSKTLIREVTPNGPVLLIEESTLVTEINNNFGSNLVSVAEVTEENKCIKSSSIFIPQ
ncbi:hypothetical protein [Flavobacterium sp. C4GT6]|uniref:hypothetical protein n=1 Tax=Flavobacterium sp. C4GT6 TaxID=3103818 RepID=UPI002ED1EEA7